MTIAAIIAICIAVLGFGVVIGVGIHYFIAYKPLQEDYRTVVDRMYRMKRQGFVPQYDIEHPESQDLSEEIREY